MISIGIYAIQIRIDRIREESKIHDEHQFELHFIKQQQKEDENNHHLLQKLQSAPISPSSDFAFCNCRCWC